MSISPRLAAQFQTQKVKQRAEERHKTGSQTELTWNKCKHRTVKLSTLKKQALYDFTPVLISKPLSKPAKNCSPSSRSHRSEGWGPSYCSDKDCTLPSICAGDTTSAVQSLCIQFTSETKQFKSYTIKAKTWHAEAEKRLVTNSTVTAQKQTIQTLFEGKHCTRTCEGSFFLWRTRNWTLNCFSLW